MGKYTRSIVVVLSIMFALVLAACGGDSDKENSSTSDGGESSKEQKLNFAASGDITTLNSLEARDSVTSVALSHLMSGLMRLDENNIPVPDIAVDDPEISEDGTVYTFELREEAVWSNGDPVTAHDYVFAWQKMVDPDVAAVYSYIFEAAGLKNAGAILDPEEDLFGEVDELGAVAIDDHTLEVTLDKPNPFFLGLLGFMSFMPINEDFYNEQGDAYAQEAENLIFNGPYTLSKWSRGDGWEYEKNPDYWDADNVTMDKVSYKVVKELSTEISLYEQDEIDIVQSLSSEFVTKYEGDPEFDTVLQSRVSYLMLNVEGVEALGNKKIRNAMLNAIDREGLTDTVLNDGSIPIQHLVPEEFIIDSNGNDFRDGEPEEGYNVMSLEEAQEMWNEGLEEVGTDTVEIDLLFSDSGGEVATNTGEYIKNQLESNLPGLSITINKQPGSNYSSLRKERNYDMSRSGWGPDYQDPMTFLDKWTDVPGNYTDWINEEYIELLEQADAAGDDEEKRFELFHEAEKLLLEEAPILPLWQTGMSYLQKSNVKGIIRNSFGTDINWMYAEIE